MALVTASVRCPHCGRPTEETAEGVIEHHTSGCPLTPTSADTEPREWVTCPLCQGNIDTTGCPPYRRLYTHLTEQHVAWARRVLVEAAQAES